MASDRNLERYIATSAVFLARDAAFLAAQRTENTYRFVISVGVYGGGIAAIVARWSRMDALVLFVVLVSVAILRAVGNGVVSAWAAKEIRRIKAAHPFPADPSGGVAR